MSPLFFRGSLLVSQKIISFTEFLEMRYCDFVKIEATHYYLIRRKDGNSTKTIDQDKQETREKLQGLDTISINELNLPKVYTDIL